MELKDLTFEVCAQLHKEMWLWLAANPKECKTDWPRISEFPFLYPTLCFACVWADMEEPKIKKDEDEDNVWDTCARCPICDVGHTSYINKCLGGLFVQWFESIRNIEHFGDDQREEMLRIRSERATEISKLPWRNKNVKEVKQNGEEV